MRLHVLSDLHIEFGPFAPPTVEADAVVLAGDTHPGSRGLTWAMQAFPDRPVIYVLGNHEFYGQMMPTLPKELKERAAGTNLHVLDNNVLTLQDVTFLGATMWTDFCLLGDPAFSQVLAQLGMSDYHVIRHPANGGVLEPEQTRRLHDQTIRWLRAQAQAHRGRKLVIVTHHAPSGRSVHARFSDNPLNPGYASNLDQLVEESQASLWIHGHLHHAADYRVGQTRVLSNPRGYPEEPEHGFNPALVVEV